MIGNGQRRRKLVRLGCTAAASMIGAASWPLCGPAVAAGVPKVSVSPGHIVLKNQYYQTTHALAGTGAVVTVRVGPNKVLRPGWPVEVQECQPDPVSLNDCDMLTTLGYDQLTKRRVEAKPNGSVTIHFLVWAPLPNRWDTGSVIKVGPGHPTELWIGDDPSHWATSGLVSAPVLIGNVPAPVKKPAHHKAATQGASGSSGDGLLGTLVVVGVAALGVVGGLAATMGRRLRHRPALG